MLVAEMSMIKITWVLREVMARYKIKNKELAEAFGRNDASISRIKTTDEMPEFNGGELESLCNALTRVLKNKGINKVISPGDLLSWESIDEE